MTTFYQIFYREEGRRKAQPFDDILYTVQEAREERDRLQEQTQTLVFEVVPVKTYDVQILTTQGRPAPIQ